MEILGKIENLHPVLNWVRHELNGQFDLKTLKKLELAVEEVVVNIIEHSYKKQTGYISIEIEFVPQGQVEITISDQAPPFNPLLAPVEKKEIGGVGLPLVKQLVDQVRYCRDKGKNKLTLIKATHTS